MATVNGRPIARQRVVELLLLSHGSRVLEQLIGLEVVMTAAAERRLTVARADVKREHDRTLRRLAGSLTPLSPRTFDREDAERLLDAVLADRNMSRAEFEILAQRNAYLRRIVESEQTFTEKELRLEYARVCGERAAVRHIQLGTLVDVTRMRERLDAGEEFGELATRYSANVASAANQGLLDPFSAQDERAPSLLREVAFGLQPGEVSDAVRIGNWYHLVKLEEILPGEDRGFEHMRTALERSLRERVTEPTMLELFEKLVGDATIEIHDPALAETPEDEYPKRRR